MKNEIKRVGHNATALALFATVCIGLAIMLGILCMMAMISAQSIASILFGMGFFVAIIVALASMVKGQV